VLQLRALRSPKAESQLISRTCLDLDSRKKFFRLGFRLCATLLIWRTATCAAIACTVHVRAAKRIPADSPLLVGRIPQEKSR
jgi:hypothetical protein